MKKWFAALLLAAAALFTPNPASAQLCTGASHVWDPATPGAADVLACINMAASGDTIVVPAGTATWTSSVTVTKNLNFTGAGIGSTIITLDGGTTIGYLRMQTFTGRITGFTWVLNSGDQVIQVRGQNWRIDHNSFTRSGTISANRVCVYSSGGTGVPHPTGVIDHNDFHNCRYYIQADLRIPAPEPATIWQDVSKIGNPNQTGVIYIEDNQFLNTSFLGNATDTQYDARLVSRFNTFQNNLDEFHSADGPPNDRGTRSWEVYNNTYNATVNTFTPISIRAGTGMAFGNTITGSYNNAGQMDNVRSFALLSNGSCNGADVRDGNITVGWPCRDQIGRGQDLGTTFPSPQTNEPAYFWMNTKSAVFANPSVVNCGSAVKTGGSCADILSDRDYYTGSAGPNTSPGSPFNGTTGVGWGVRANRPATCTTGVAYWSTDGGTNWNTINGSGVDGGLDKCVSTNTWSNDAYVPYTYPHPLTAAGGTTPTPPTVSLSASPSSIISGNSSLLTWSSTDTATCTASGGWTGAQGLSGSQSVSPTVTTTYTLSCTGPGGTASRSTTVTVTPLVPPPPTATITANGVLGSTTIPSGNAATIAWSSTNTTTCSVAPTGWTGTSGSQSSGPLTVDTTYTLSCSGLGGSATAVVDVLISPITPPNPHPCGGHAELIGGAAVEVKCNPHGH